MKILPFNEDSFLSTNGTLLPFDKLEHFLREFFLILLNPMFLKIDMTGWIIAVVAFGILWEVKDGYFAWGNRETNPDRMIEGFSFKDLIADWFGIAAGLLVWQLS